MERDSDDPTSSSDKPASSTSMTHVQPRVEAQSRPPHELEYPRLASTATRGNDDSSSREGRAERIQ